MSDVTIIYSHGMCGMGRLGLLDRRFVAGLESTGLDIRVNDWACHPNPLRNLRDRDQHRRAADQLLRLIDDARRDEPERRIALVGHSTGCLVMLEAMPQLDVPVDDAVFMAAAVEPAYDLSGIGGRARRLLNLYSCFDFAMLCVGTTLMGTANGFRCAAAGWRGFRPDHADAARIEQRPWTRRWIRHGHLGVHTGYLDPRFAAGYVVPMLLTDADASTDASTGRPASSDLS